MGIQTTGIRHTLDFFADLDAFDRDDIARVQWLLDGGFPFRAQRELADTLHLHVKVADTAALPDDAIRNAGAREENRAPGYVKFAFPSGLNMIFSSIPVAEDDRLPDAQPVTRAFLDHAGIDLRAETRAVRRGFDDISETATRLGWRLRSQGGADRAVYCCHTQVSEKHWVYPPTALAVWHRPIEFAYGPLVVHGASMGCDLRPMDPDRAARVTVKPATSCCGPSASPSCCK